MRFEKYMMLVGITALLVGAGCGTERPDPVEEDTGTEPAPPEYAFDNDPAVPQSCDEAEAAAEAAREGDKDAYTSSAGCLFYGVSLDGSNKERNYGFVLANVNASEPAQYRITGPAIDVWPVPGYPDQEEPEGEWRVIASGTISPLGQEKISWRVEDTGEVDDDGDPIVQLYPLLVHVNYFSDVYRDFQNPRALVKKGAYQIWSSVPITAYQFTPIDPDRSQDSKHTSDASMLLPVTSWDTNYQVAGYRATRNIDMGYFTPGNAVMELPFFAVVADEDSTVVKITPSAKTRISHEKWYEDSVIIPEMDPAGAVTEITHTLDKADVLFVHATEMGATLSGSLVESVSGQPIGVFSGHQCAFIPENFGFCDNIEEQIPGTSYWGNNFIASRYPNRNRTNYSDPVLWQIHAKNDNTELRFAAAEGVKGLPADGETIVLNAGEYHEMMVYGGVAYPGDFALKATQPVAVLSYMTGFTVVAGTNDDMGDPAMAYVPPVEQFLGRYIVNVPSGWELDYMVVTRHAGVGVLLDGQPVDDSLFQPVPKVDATDKDMEVARISIWDGAHVLESEDRSRGLGLVVTGLEQGNSYAYTGGMGFRKEPALQ